MEERALINVGVLVSFDCQYLYNALPRFYELADKIVLAVDHEYRTWSGKTFSIPNEFWDWIKKVDVEGKIEVYKDNFFLPELSALENDTRERNLLAQRMGDGGWHIQIDSDEYFIDFNSFVKYLQKNKHLLDKDATSVDVGAFLIPMYKQTENGFMIIPKCPETVVLATNKPEYKAARRSNHFVMYTPFYLFHQTWARPADEIHFKINNWGHINDFDVEGYFQKWLKLDTTNYSTYRNFHPLVPHIWKSLSYVEGKTVDAFIDNYLKNYPSEISPLIVLKKHIGQRINRLLKGKPFTK
jgi:hypothetical protein